MVRVIQPRLADLNSVVLFNLGGSVGIVRLDRTHVQTFKLALSTLRSVEAILVEEDRAHGFFEGLLFMDKDLSNFEN